MEGSAVTKHVMTRRAVLRSGLSLLEHAGIEDPRLNAERLLEYVLGISRTDLYAYPDDVIMMDARRRYETLIERRCEHEPLQYILGKTEFMSLSFGVTHGVLIPRPETEILVEMIIEKLSDEPGRRILDIGTGSGCIAVSLAHYLLEAEIVGIDISKSAIETARENARRNRVESRIRFTVMDISTEPFPGELYTDFDVVVSNPPYIALEEWDTLPKEVRAFEPRSALCDEGDGLSFYRIMASKAKHLVKTGGTVFWEVGDSQGEAVKAILSGEGYQDVSVYPDLNGVGRVVSGRW